MPLGALLASWLVVVRAEVKEGRRVLQAVFNSVQLAFHRPHRRLKGEEMEDQASSQIYAPHLKSNLQTLFSIKFYTSLFAGSVAGILGLTNLSGFALFALSIAFTAALVGGLKCKGRPREFIGDLKSGVNALLIPGMDNVSGFILSWTLFYG